MSAYEQYQAALEVLRQLATDLSPEGDFAFWCQLMECRRLKEAVIAADVEATK